MHDKQQELRTFRLTLYKTPTARGLSQKRPGWRTHTDQEYISQLERELHDPGLRVILNRHAASAFSPAPL